MIMIRKIIQIDEKKCNGCGLCAQACHEGAIGMVNGKAILLRDDYCDGLGDCLPSCPTGAISFVEREAMPYDESAVLEHQKKIQGANAPARPAHGGCPGQAMRQLSPAADAPLPAPCPPSHTVTSQLGQWPVQIKLAPVTAAYFRGAHLLIAADCTAYAYGSFHQDFMKGKITLIGCPKLDSTDYSGKLAEIIASNDIKSVTILRMEVPCCGGIENAAVTAMKNSGKFLPWQVVTISVDGKVVER